MSDLRGINIHTFQSGEFESDLYRGVMHARCYPFNMEHHLFWGRNVKMSTYTWYMYCMSCVYAGICWSYSWHIHVLSCSCALQDCSATIPPHPFYIGERDNNNDVAESLFDPDSMCFVSPQLFFHCTLRPIGTVAGSSNHSDEDIPLDLVFFRPFEELRLRTAGIMESKGIHRVYEPSPVSTPTSEGLMTS